MPLSNLVVGQPFCVDGNTPVVPLTWVMGGALSVSVKKRAKENGIDETVNANVTGTSINVPYQTGLHYIFVVVNNANPADILIFGNAGNPGPDPADFRQTVDVCAVPPFAPNTLTASAAGNNAVNLAWVDGSDNEVGFEIQRSTNATTGFTTLVTTTPGVMSYQDQSAQAGTTYYYRVRAVNQYGQSAFTNTASATTTGTAPTGGGGGGSSSGFWPTQNTTPTAPAQARQTETFVLLGLLIAVYFLFFND